MVLDIPQWSSGIIFHQTFTVAPICSFRHNMNNIFILFCICHIGFNFGIYDQLNRLQCVWHIISFILTCIVLYCILYYRDLIHCCMQATDREIPAVVTQVRARIKGQQASVDGQGRVDVAAFTRWSSIRHTGSIPQPLPTRWPSCWNSITHAVQLS